MSMRFIGVALLLFVGVVGWRVGENLSSDAVGMAVGLLLGVMAGVPTALLVLASQRREREYDRYERPRQRTTHQQLPAPMQPPVIVVTGQRLPRQAQQQNVIEQW